MTKGWRTERLIDFASVSTGPFGSLLHKSDYVSDGVPLVNPINIVGERIIPDPEKRIDKKTVLRLASYILQQGDIVVARRGELGRCAAIGPGESGWVCGTGCFFIRPGSDIEPRFLAAMLRSDRYRSELEAASIGATMPSISNTTLSELLISIPERHAQQRIVAILDEAFAGIATAKANAEANLQNARAIFEGHLQSVFSRGDAGWSSQHLGELVTFRNGINFTKSSAGTAIKILGVKDFQKNFLAPLDRLDSVVPDGLVPDADLLQENDVVFVRSNGNPELIGRCLLIGKMHERTTYSGFTIRARLQTDEVSPTYLCHFLKSGAVRRQLIDGGNGANIKSLNQGGLSALVVPYPSLAEQAEIVLGLEAIRAETQRLESLYTRKIAALDELKQSLLHQAFSGQL